MEEKSPSPASAGMSAQSPTEGSSVTGEPPRSAETPRPTANRSGAGWLAALAILLSLGALAAVGWSLQRDSDRQQMTEFRLQSAVQGQATALERLRERLADERAEGRSDRRDLRQQLETLNGQLQRQAQHLSELSQSDRTDWRLAELDYLLKLARQKLLLGENPRLALEMLESSDAIARDLDDPDLLPLRTALANDLAVLRGLPSIDVEGLYFSLEAVAGRVANLQLVTAEVAVHAPAADSEAAAGWRQRLRFGFAEAWERLSGLVQVRRRDEPYEPLLAPQFEASLRQHLLLLVEQAQLALLAGNQRLYNDSLSQAASWAQRYFAVDQTATQAVVEQLEQLAAQPVSIEAPDIAESQRALRDYLRDVARRRGEVAPSQAQPQPEQSTHPASSSTSSTQGAGA